MNIRKCAAVLAACALGLMASATSSEATTYNYGQFSMMYGRNAGQYDDVNGYPSGQWAWIPPTDGSTVANIQWGDPATWPPATAEQFERSTDGQWVLMDGYTTNGVWEPQVVTREVMGDVTCAGETDITPQDGKERYAEWTVPTSGYCLETWGQILVPGAAPVDFHHRQIWHVPANCTNQYMGTDLCVRDHEWWEDNNPANGGTPGGPLIAVQDRDVYFALNVGPAYIIHDYLHGGWEAFDRYAWTY